MPQPSKFQGLPNMSTPVINPDGTMNFTWFSFFQSLWRKEGLGPNPGAGEFNRIGVIESGARSVGGTLVLGGPNASCAIGSDAGPILMIYDVQTGEAFGYIRIPNVF